MSGAAKIEKELEGLDIAGNPGVLAAFYHAYDLSKWRDHVMARVSARAVGFKLEDGMPVWVGDPVYGGPGHLAFLSAAVGQPELP